MKKTIKFILLAIIVGVLASASYQLYQSKIIDNEEDNSENEEYLQDEKKDDNLSLIDTKENDKKTY